MRVAISVQIIPRALQTFERMQTQSMDPQVLDTNSSSIKVDSSALLAKGVWRTKLRVFKPPRNTPREKDLEPTQAFLG